MSTRKTNKMKSLIVSRIESDPVTFWSVLSGGMRRENWFVNFAFRFVLLNSIRGGFRLRRGSYSLLENRINKYSWHTYLVIKIGKVIRKKLHLGMMFVTHPFTYFLYSCSTYWIERTMRAELSFVSKMLNECL